MRLSRTAVSRTALAAAAVALVAPHALAQQAAPSVSLLAGVGAGSAPDLTRQRIGGPTHAPAPIASVGARVRPGSRLFVDATVSAVGAIMVGDEVLVAPVFTPGVAYRRLARRLDGTEAFVSAEARAGVEASAGRALVRASAGGGYMWEVRQPFVALAAGVGTSGRRARVTLDVEHRRFSVPMDEFSVRTDAPTVPVVSRVVDGGLHATFVRAGVELALGRR